ncbi:hypothetical protein [Amycolatopsis sp. DSM 110486]|uniref:hypothetical protein n=1 Tax=Amycolatopsis sp. DSM 110486 TaxID=2865832 RepID=UPI001C697A6A|nr:hypothetical protein [Amycolatopsis sp. DSM 110486]QYN17502.1 hypothetical protein K1T34_32470 [Amycolatopsis sp. DSM 110486]
MIGIDVFQDDDGDVYVVGTHDVARARDTAERYALAEDFGDWGPDLADEPRLWWSVPKFDARAEEHLFAVVPAGTFGAVAVASWHC